MRNGWDGISRGLETILAGVGAGGGDRGHHVLDVLGGVAGGLGEVIAVPNEAGIQAELGGGLRLLEVQQSSDITYRLFDWGRGRECHIEKGIASIKSGGIRDVAKFPGVFSCPYFTLEEVTVESKYSDVLPPAKGDARPSDYVLFFVIGGEGEVNGEKASKEDIFAFAPGEEVKATGVPYYVIRHDL